MVSSCEFGDQEDSLTRDRIVLKTQDKSLQEGFLRVPQLSLQRATKSSKEQTKSIVDQKSDVNATRIKNKKI